jgi:hypothetical protein
VDCNFFILSVDLWDPEGRQEQNLVMHPSNTTAAALAGSSGSSPTTPSGYQQSWAGGPPMDNQPYHYQSEYNPNPGYVQPTHNSNQNYQPGYPSAMYPSGPAPMHPAYPPEDQYGTQHSQGGSFTRNLIGSLTASAFRLKDDKDVPGIWFILQDLSVRTEGTFRLKFSFLNLGMYVHLLCELMLVPPRPAAAIVGQACLSIWENQKY